MRVGAKSRVLVTGASSGIGLACAEACAARGAEVGLIARRAEVLKPLSQRLPGSRALSADVTDGQQLQDAIEAFAADGGIDLLIANAGVAHYGSFVDQSFELIEQMVATNVLGVFRTVHLALPGMIARGRGHIAVIASGASLRSFPYAAAYGGTKAAELGFAEALRHELAGTGVSLTAVLPGEVKTALHAHDRDQMPAWYDSEGAIPPSKVAEALIAGVEANRRIVSVPKKVRLLGLNGVAPGLVDRIIARLRGRTAAPGLGQEG
jgi:short-subunit dehydrogenase